jgi:hypothetical protein
MCTVLLPPGGNAIAVNKYITSCHIKHSFVTLMQGIWITSNPRADYADIYIRIYKKNVYECYGGIKHSELQNLFCFKNSSTNWLFIHSVFCLTTGPTPLPKRSLHIVWPRASSFKWEYPLQSLRSSNSFLRLLPRRLVTSISKFIFPSITCLNWLYFKEIQINAVRRH